MYVNWTKEEMDIQVEDRYCGSVIPCTSYVIQILCATNVICKALKSILQFIEIY